MTAAAEAGAGLRAAPVTSASYEEAVERYIAEGWTDGLPIIPPTPERVREFLHVAGLAPEEELGSVPTRGAVVVAEAAAINAVMAGCAPEHFPLVVAAVRAQLRRDANAHSTTATLAGAAQVVIVNGPVRAAAGVHAGQACFGPGFRANASVGRALRLTIRNVLRAVPGVLDRATFSSPFRYSFCFGEDEEATDWTPLHVQRGFDAADGVVTLCSMMHYVRATCFEAEPAAIAAAIVREARHIGLNHDEFLGDGRSIVLVVGAEQRRRFVAAGWTKERIQERLWPDLTAPSRGVGDLRLDLASPANILVVVAGGPGMAESWLLMPHLSNPVSERVVAPVPAGRA